MINKKMNRRTKRVIETIMSVVLMIVMFVIAPGMTGYIDTHYTMNCEVTNIDKNIITVIDSTGNLWDFCGDELLKGDAVKVTFFNNTTDSTREDDEIIKVIKVTK